MQPDYVIYFDGGGEASAGGRIAIGAVVCTPAGEVVTEGARWAGEGTTNVAEYRALAYAISLARLVGARRPLFVGDSALVVQQVNGFWATRGDPHSPLVREHSRCSVALMGFDRWVLKHVKREHNRRADWLVCQLLEHKRTLKKAPPVTPVARVSVTVTGLSSRATESVRVESRYSWDSAKPGAKKPRAAARARRPAVASFMMLAELGGVAPRDS